MARRSPPRTPPGTSTASPGFKDVEGLVLIDGGLLGSFDLFTLEEAQDAIEALETSNPFLGPARYRNPRVGRPLRSRSAVLRQTETPRARLRRSRTSRSCPPPSTQVSRLRTKRCSATRSTGTPHRSPCACSTRTWARSIPMPRARSAAGRTAASRRSADCRRRSATSLSTRSSGSSQAPLNRHERRQRVGAERRRRLPGAAPGAHRRHRRSDLRIPDRSHERRRPRRRSKILWIAPRPRKKDAKLVEGAPEQSHLDPLTASPEDNEFLKTVVKFLKD